MAKRDVDNYFNQVTRDYSDMVEALRDMEEEASKNLVSPEQLESMKSQVETIKNNYLRISYIIYLLNRPNKKTKHERYDKSKSFREKDTLDGVKKENREILDNIGFNKK